MTGRHTCITILQVFVTIVLTNAAQIPLMNNINLQQTIKHPTIEVKCNTGHILITVVNPPQNYEDIYFSGMIYPKDLSKNSTCLTKYYNQNGSLLYKLPLKSCNTMSRETMDGVIEYSNTIVLQPHLKLVTNLTTEYFVSCKYSYRNAVKNFYSTITNSLETAEPYRSGENDQSQEIDRREHARSMGKILKQKINDISSNEIPLPGCHMKIYSGNTIAENVKIGDPLTLVINIDKQDIYGLHVTDCLVRDGLELGEQKLVNTQGCPLDSEIMGPFKYSEDKTIANVTFPAHKFPYTASVYYQCNVRLCALQDPECKKPPLCGINARTKRQSEKEDEGLPATIEVYSGLYVNENAETTEPDEDSVYKEKTPEDALCVSQRTFAIAIAVAGLILMLSVVAAVLCIMVRRRSKTISNSGSSIYSGPYTNTAFSHSS